MKADAALLQSICKESQDPDFCNRTLATDPRVAAANLDALALISISLPTIQVQGTLDNIPGILRQTSDSLGKQRLGVCQTDYNDALGQFRGAYNSSNAKAYMDVINWVRDGTNRVIDCENIYKRDPIRVSPITTDNHNVIKLEQTQLSVDQNLTNTMIPPKARYASKTSLLPLNSAALIHPFSSSSSFLSSSQIDAIEAIYPIVVRGLVPVFDTDGFNALLRALCEAKTLVDAKIVYHRLLKDFVPNLLTFNILISGSKSVDQMELFFEEMREFGVSLTVVSYDSLVDKYCRRNEIEKAFEVVKKIREEGVLPDAVTESRILPSLEGRGIRILSECGGINAAIKGYCTANRVDDDAYKLMGRWLFKKHITVEMALSLRKDMMEKAFGSCTSPSDELF
ncbi:unnamed protein product [Dovyalis caffra]|uniref:Pectinesterase inhibitor domain-containing protein n=1 Tax=Dovyalis caffra TaxID=77055 RepID=A0AAV1SDL8_9ROSI|nr:unnamed protein product [Dovyalis caffra]